MKTRISWALILTIAIHGLPAQVTNTGYFTIANGTQVTIGTDVTNGASGTWTNKGTLDLKGDFTNNGTMTIPTAGTTTFTGTSIQSLDGTADHQYHAPLFDNANGYTINATLNLYGTATFTNGRLERDATSDVVFQDGATSTGSSANSYVHGGRVIKTGSAASGFTFPVGTATNYGPVTISSLSGTESLSATYSSANPKTDIGNALTSPLEDISNVEYWELDVLSGTPSATVRLAYTEEVSDVPAEASDLAHNGAVAYYDNAASSWKMVGKDAGTLSLGTLEDVSAFGFFTLGLIPSFSPGGVETDLEFWLKADENVLFSGGNTVSSWHDSYNSFDFTTVVGDPQQDAAGLNYNPVIAFDNSDGNDHLSDSHNLDIRSFFIVYSHTSTGGDETPFTNDNGLFHGHTDNSQVYSSATTSVIARDGDSFVNSDSTNLLSHLRPEVPELHSRILSANETGPYSYYIGQDGTSHAMTGSIAEIAAYSSSLSDAEKGRVESYLALKYGISLDQGSPTNYVNSDNEVIWNADADIDYVYGIAGIGRDDASSLNQRQSVSVATDALLSIGLDGESHDGLETSNADNDGSFSADLSFLIWAHNNAPFENSTNSEYDPTQVDSRFNREWRVQERGDVGPVILVFDISTLPGPTGVGTNDDRQVVLMVDVDGDFSEGTQVVNQSLVIDGDNLVIFRVDLSDGDYFTLGSWEAAALPITLLSFDAKAMEDHVALEWVTASEFNNSHFRVERSPNGLDYESILTRPGQGTTSDVNSYQATDLFPLEGSNYYRLVDVSITGEESTSEVVLVRFEGEAGPAEPYPNPVKTGALLNLLLPATFPGASLAVAFYDVSGNMYRPGFSLDGRTLQISTEGLAQGAYLLRVISDAGGLSHTIMVRD